MMINLEEAIVIFIIVLELAVPLVILTHQRLDKGNFR